MSRNTARTFSASAGFAGLAHILQTRSDAASSSGDLFVRRAFDTLLEIHQARADKDWMRVRIHEPGQDNFASAIDLSNFLAILL